FNASAAPTQSKATAAAAAACQTARRSPDSAASAGTSANQIISGEAVAPVSRTSHPIVAAKLACDSNSNHANGARVSAASASKPGLASSANAIHSSES